MNRNSFLISFLCCVVIGVFASGSRAVMKGLSTEELTKSADTVIIGEVADVQAQWSKDGSSIFTIATIDVSQVVRGQTLPARISVEYEGGEVGDIGLRVSDVGTLEKGEKVLLFLKTAKSKKDGSAYTMVGKSQGTYRIGADGIASKSGFSVMDGQDAIESNIPLSDLVKKIRSIR